MLKIQGKPETASKTFKLPKELAEKLERVACENNYHKINLQFSA